jgi:ferredoxin
VLTGIEVPHGRRSTDFGVQCFNVGTAFSIHEALEHGRPLVSRLVTVAGNVTAPRNYDVLIGTPMDHLVRLAGPRPDTDRYIMGGPMMGVRMPAFDVPVVKATNCILVGSAALFPPPPPEMPCIRCGECAKACPADLAPFEMYWFSRSKNFGKAQEYHLFDCIECGCCSFVCPSHIPLVDYFRFSKSEIWAREREKESADGPASASSSRTSARNARSRKRPKSSPPRPPPPAKRSPTEGAATPAAADGEARRKPKPSGDDAKRALIEAAMEKARQQKAQVAPRTPTTSPGRGSRDRRHRGPPGAERPPGRRHPAASQTPEHHPTRLPMINSPFVRKAASVQSVMLQVLLALVPGIAAYVWFFGAGILVQLAIASAAALAGEAAMLAIRGKPKALFLTDLSAVVTAWLIALTFPAHRPLVAHRHRHPAGVVVVKQLYGGLGQNPFNPAMAAFCLMIVAYPALMSQWPAAGQLDFKTQLDLIFGGLRQVDAITGATPLDALRTALRSAASPDSQLHGLRTSQLMDGPAFGAARRQGQRMDRPRLSRGGLWLISSASSPGTFRRPSAARSSPLPAALGHAPRRLRLAAVPPGLRRRHARCLLHPDRPGFGCHHPPRQAAVCRRRSDLTYVIRSFGAFPDGIAFATLLMNILVP